MAQTPEEKKAAALAKAAAKKEADAAKKAAADEAKQADLMAEAVDLGIEVTGEEDIATLEAAIAKAKEDQDDGKGDAGASQATGVTATAGPAATPTKAEKAAQKGQAAKNVDTGSVDVVAGDEYIRTYSEDVHGANYRELAEQMAGKKEGRSVVESDTIVRVLVEYREFDPKVKETVDRVKEFSERDGADFKEAAIEFNMQVRGSIRVRNTPAK